MSKPDSLLDELSCLTSALDFSPERLESCLIRALECFQGGSKKRQSTVAQILSENIQVLFSRILVRLQPEVVCKSLGFIVAFACGLLEDGIDFALGESFLRFVDTHVFDNPYLSHLVSFEVYAVFVRALVLSLKRPDSRYPQKSLLPWIRKALSNSNWDLDLSVMKSLLDTCIEYLRSSSASLMATKGEVFHILSEIFTRAPTLLADPDASLVNGDRAETVSFLVDEATASIEDKAVCKSACSVLRTFISMSSLSASSTRALSTTLLSVLESSDSIIPRDQRLRSSSSLQISLLFVDLVSLNAQNPNSTHPCRFNDGSSSLLSNLFSSKASVENVCVILTCSLSKDPSLINVLDIENAISKISSTLEKIHRVADVVFFCLSAMSSSFTHFFNGPKQRYASIWDNACGSLIKFCKHRSSDLSTFHGPSAALKSLLPLCSGLSFYAQLESFLLLEHSTGALELYSQFSSFVPSSRVLKERSIALAGKLALDCISQFMEDSTHSRLNRHERSLRDVVISARACAKTIIASSQCQSSSSSGISALENVVSLLPYLPSRWSFRGRCVCPIDGDISLAGLVSPDGSAYRRSDGFRWPLFVSFSSEIGFCSALKSMSLRELQLDNVRTTFFLREQKSIFEAATQISLIDSLNDLQKSLEAKTLARRAHVVVVSLEEASIISHIESSVTSYIASIVKKSDIQHTRLADMCFLALVVLECTYACVYDEKMSADIIEKFEFFAVVFSKAWLEKMIKSFKSSSSIDFEEFLTALHLVLPIIVVCIALHQHCHGVHEFLQEFSNFLFDDVLPALVQSMTPTNFNNRNSPFFDRFSCCNIMDIAVMLLWCTKVRRRYSHELIQGLCLLVHDGNPIGSTAILIVYGFRNRLERVPKEMDSLFAISDEKCLNAALFGKQDPSKFKDLLNVPSWFFAHAFLVRNCSESSRLESLFHQSVNNFILFSSKFREANKSSMEKVFILDASIFLLRFLLSFPQNSQQLLRFSEIRARVDSEVAQILLSNISYNSSFDDTLLKVLSALFIEDVCKFFDFAQVWQSTLENLPFDISKGGELTIRGRLNASHGILGLATLFSFGIARPPDINIILPVVIQIVQKYQSGFVSNYCKSMLDLFARKLHISGSWALVTLFGPELLKNCITSGCSFHFFPWSIFSISSHDQAMNYMATCILPATLNSSTDFFGFEQLSCIDQVDMESAYWSVIIEIILCHVEGSAESSVSSVVQKKLNFIHKKFAPFPNSLVVEHLKATRSTGSYDATFVTCLLGLLVQRMLWVGALDDGSWNQIQSSFKNSVDVLFKLMKRLVSTSSWHFNIMPASFQDLLKNTSLVRIFLSKLLEKAESCSCNHDHVRFSAVMIAIIESSVEFIFQSHVKIKCFSRHVSFCFHVVMRLTQFTHKCHILSSLVCKVLFANVNCIVCHPAIFVSFVTDIGALLLFSPTNPQISKICRELVQECCSCIQSLKTGGVTQKLHPDKKISLESNEFSTTGLLLCDLPALEEFKPFIALLISLHGNESFEKSINRWIGIAQSRSLNGTSMEHQCALQALHLRRLLSAHDFELKHSCSDSFMQLPLSLCASILLESATRWGSSQIISEAVGECLSLLAITAPASSVCFSPSTNQILDDSIFLQTALKLILSFWFCWKAETATAAICDIEEFVFTQHHLGDMSDFHELLPSDLFSSDARYFHKHVFDDSKDFKSRLTHHICCIQEENYDYHIKNIVLNLSVSLPVSNESIRILLSSCCRTVSTSTIYTDLISPRVFLHSFASSSLTKELCCEQLLHQQQIALQNSSNHKFRNKGLCRLMTNVRVHAKSCIVQQMGSPGASTRPSLPFNGDPFDSDPLSAAMIADIAGMRSAAILLLEPLDASATVRFIDSRWGRWNGLCGISDAISLICGADTSSDQSDDFFFKFSENWSCSLAHFDSHCISFTNPSPDAVLGVVDALQHLGGHHVANRMLESIDRPSDPALQRSIDSIYHKNALKCDFSQTFALKKQYQASLFGLETKHCFETIMYSALTLLHQNLVTECKAACNRAVELVISDFADMDVLSVMENQNSLAKLRSCFEVGMLCQHYSSSDILNHVLQVCSSRIPIHWDFEAHDLISNVRRGMVSAIVRVLHTDLSPKLAHFQLAAARTARKHKKISYAHALLMQASSVVGIDPKLIIIERAKLAWAAGERRRAMSIISSLEGASAEYRALRWTIEDRADAFDDVKSRVFAFTASIDSAKQKGIISSQKSITLLSKIRYAFATYADSMYQNLFEFLKSPEFLQQSRIQQALGAEAEKLKNDSRSHQSKRRNIETQVDVQQNVLSATFSNFHMYFAHALQSYSYVLKIGERCSLSAVLRFASLLFSSSLASSEEVSISSLFDGISEQQFLPIFMQFIARLKDDASCDGMFASFADSKIAERNSQLQKELRKLVARVGIHYPHHVVFELHSFLQEAPSASGASRNRTVDNVGGKRATAQQILKEIQKRVPQLIKQVQAITTAMLNVACLKAESSAVFQKNVEKSVKKLSEDSHAYSSVPLPCRSWFDFDVKPITVHFISSEVVLLGGVHKPRKIKIVGSDGQSYFAILKGNDELRQDLVIQQSFNIINKLFDADAEARKRRLHMRTYNVVLLSPSAGILEMVSHSQSLTEYLVGPSQCPLKPDFSCTGAHERYRPTDDLHQKIRQHWDSVYKREKGLISAAECKRLLKNAYDSMQPVLRFFMIESSIHSSMWLAKRVQYTNSLAVGSIVGYVIGLGDRHANNILIDNNTSELTHIDLGIAFDRGMLLPVPERIPFRLTRDLVDALGPFGTKGLFLGSCENSMRVLRLNRDALLGVFDVLLHDPLTDWSGTISKVIGIQSADAGAEIQIGEEVSLEAESTLLGIKNKLSGIHCSEMLSVSAHVKVLCQEAQDPERLACIYHGWSPWL